MARYQLRRPTPIHILTTLAKRQEAGLGAVGPGSSAEEGPESPDSPGSSPSTTGVPSPGDSSDSEDDEPPSPKEGNASTSTQATATSTSTATPVALPPSTSEAAPSASSQAFTLLSSKAAIQTSSSTTTSTPAPAFTQDPTSQGIGAVAPPQATDPSATTVTTVTTTTSSTQTSTTQTSITQTSTTQTSSTASPTSPVSPTSTISRIFSSKIARPTQPISSSISPSSLPPPTRTGVPVGEDDPPRRTRPEPTLMSKGAEAAAITLSIIGAIALVVGILFYCKRRKRRRNEKLEAELERDAANHAAMRAPEAAHFNSIAPFAGSGPHMTQSSDRSNTLFGPGSYSRPETVSTRNGSHISKGAPTPNPFADPPLNKAYDVLAGRPRSTTLTDRGSWIKNPFKDPESERFDPFGELQAKARRERVKQVEIARREAELERQFEAKEKMGLMPPQKVAERKGSGVTLEGIGVLDRSNGGAYR